MGAKDELSKIAFIIGEEDTTLFGRVRQDCLIQDSRRVVVLVVAGKLQSRLVPRLLQDDPNRVIILSVFVACGEPVSSPEGLSRP
jgi:hypothetical protein